MLEVEVDGDTEVIINTNVEVTAGNMNVAIIEDTNDIEVTVNRQEYVITGDEIYIPKRFEDAPTWMQELITQVVDTSISAQIQDLNGISQSLESMIDAMEVAKNTYELSIISSNDIDQRINTAVTTLNSSMNDADATVLEVAQTRVTPEEASAITVDVITAELAKTEAGTLGATVSNLQIAVANEEEARSTSIEILTSSIEGAFDANATAMNYLNTYVGLDEVGASTGTGLSGYLESSTGIIGGADSKVVNNVYVDALGNAKSKFEYGSTVSVNGVNHTAGFGLSNSTGTGIGSEFWINADKFKFTNNNKTGSKAPFTIDATGTVPEITFNGKVSFNNVTDYTPPDISGTINNNNDVFAQRLGYLSYADMVAAATAGQTIINGGYLRSELIEANSINAGQIDAYAITGKHISGGTITGTHIIGSVIKGSYIDLTSTLALTNWQYYTPATIPVGYEANFAHHNDGSLVVDSQGYVRLAGQQNFIVPPIVTSGTISGTTRTLNLIYDLYSWDSYNVDTLQRGIRRDTAFTSTAELVFSGYGNGPIDGQEHAGYGTNFSFIFLDKNISVSVSSFGSNNKNAANSSIAFNGVTVASAIGSLGRGLDRPWDTGWLDYSTTIKGIPIRIKTTIDGKGAITFEFKATLSSTNGIINHSLNDVIKIISVYVGGNTITRNLTYNINFPSVWVQ